MNKFSAFTLIAAGIIATAGASYAAAPRGTHDPRINARQHNQRERICQGVRSGELTRRETARLAEGQRDIRQLEHAYKSDGTLTRYERRDLQHELNQQNRVIYRQLHDADQRL
jgi:hypothetical protein